MGRIMGIDYGNKRVGLAITDPLQLFASPMETISSGEFDNFMTEYMGRERVEAFVVGYPVQLNNKPSESVKYIDPFIRKLKKTYPAIPVHLVDERFTSQIALRTMIEGGVKKEKRRDKWIADKISASLILQSFLDSRTANNKTKTKE